MIGSETFIIVAFRCTEKSTPALLGVGDLLGEEGIERGAAHHRGVDDLAGEDRDRLLEHGDVPSAATCSIRTAPSRSIVTERSVERKSSVAHRRDVRARVRGPLAHRVRVLARVLLDRGGRAAVGVALAQHRVDRAALDLVVARADLALLVVAGLVGVVGDAVALLLELLDRGLELRHRGADVGQLDDVRLGLLSELAELGERVGDRWSSSSRSGNWARIRPASEMSRVSISMSAAPANARRIGSSEWVASAGASSVSV